MKLILEIKTIPNKDDVLIYDGKQWKPISQRLILLETNKKVKELSDELSQLKSDVNAKLKDFHEVLQLVSQKEE